MKVAVVVILVVASIIGVQSAAVKEKKSEVDGEKIYEACIEKSVGALKSVDTAALTKVEGSCAETLKKELSVDKLTATLTKAIGQVNTAAEGALKNGGAAVKDIVKSMHAAFEGITDKIAGILKPK